MPAPSRSMSIDCAGTTRSKEKDVEKGVCLGQPSSNFSSVTAVMLILLSSNM